MADKKVMQAVILAGGLGTRLRPLTLDKPKPMVDVNGRPFLCYLLQQLKSQGIQRILLLTGYLHNVIEDYFGDGSAFGLSITYSQGDPSWETGRRLFRAVHLLDPHFFLLYGDNYINYRLSDLVKFYQTQQAPLSLVVVKKLKGNISINERSNISLYDPSRQSAGLNFVELGFMCVERSVISTINDTDNPSFSATLIRLAQSQNIAAFQMFDQYYSISDPERLALLSKYLQPKKYILLDRDGTLNVKAATGQYITSPVAMNLIPEHIAGLKLLAAEGFEFFIITNQAGLSTGDLDEVQLEAIHNKLCKQLAGHGILIKQIYVAGAHWQDHMDWERKPNPGLFFELSADHLLCLAQTWYIGDDPRDMLAARNAGCRGLFLGQVDKLSDELKEFVDLTSDNMATLSNFITKEFCNESSCDW